MSTKAQLKKTIQEYLSSRQESKRTNEALEKFFMSHLETKQVTVSEGTYLFTERGIPCLRFNVYEDSDDEGELVFRAEIISNPDDLVLVIDIEDL